MINSQKEIENIIENRVYAIFDRIVNEEWYINLEEKINVANNTKEKELLKDDLYVKSQIYLYKQGCADTRIMECILTPFLTPKR